MAGKSNKPTGVNRDVSNVEGGERGANVRVKKRQNRHAYWACRGREGNGEQFKVDNTASAGTGGGGRLGLKFVQVDRQYKNGKEGGGFGA